MISVKLGEKRVNKLLLTVVIWVLAFQNPLEGGTISLPMWMNWRDWQGWPAAWSA